MPRFLPRNLLWTLLLLPLAGGCASTAPPLGTWSGPDQPAPLTLSLTHYTDTDYCVVRTQHYIITTTISDEDFDRRLGQLMEGAFAQYQAMCPDIAPTRYPMKCFVFATRAQWAAYTSEHTGMDSDIYLHIRQGAYTVYDQYVAYYFGDGATLSVAAHEGWHQYVARHFKGRLPPFLEEGIATTFEGVQFKDGLPRFNAAINQNRDIDLRKSLEENELWPLDQLIEMHAGMVIDKGAGRVMAFYAQAWAFARFLWDGENGKYRPAFQKLLADIAHGTVWDPTGSYRFRLRNIVPGAVKPMLEHYLGVPFSQINDEYNRYIQVLAYDQMSAQSETPP